MVLKDIYIFKSDKVFVYPQDINFQMFAQMPPAFLVICSYKQCCSFLQLVIWETISVSPSVFC